MPCRGRNTLSDDPHERFAIVTFPQTMAQIIDVGPVRQAYIAGGQNTPVHGGQMGCEVNY